MHIVIAKCVCSEEFTSDLVSYSVLEIAAVFEGLNDQILTYYLKRPKIEKVKEYE